MQRIKIKTLIAPATIYQHAARYAEGYRPAANSRFAAVREDADRPWLLVHVRSGGRVGSLMPNLARKMTMTEVLNVAAAFEAATHVDWAPFDNLPQIQEGDTKSAGFAERERPAALAAAVELRRLASVAVFP